MNAPQHALFAPDTLMRCQLRHRQSVMAGAKAPWDIGVAILTFGLALFCMGFDFHVLKHVFGYLDAGQGWWSPAVMATGGMIVILGFHVFALRNAGHATVRVIEFLVGLQIPFYALGLGLFVTAMLHADGLASVVGSGDDWLAAGTAEGGGFSFAGLLEAFYEEVTSPLAVTLFELGLGTISVTAIFTAHWLICTAHARLARAREALQRVARDTRRYITVRRTRREYAETAARLARLTDRWDRDARIEGIADAVSQLAADRTAPHRAWRKEAELRVGSELEPSESTDPAVVAKSLAQIDAAFTRASVLRALTSDHQE